MAPCKPFYKMHVTMETELARYDIRERESEKGKGGKSELGEEKAVETCMLSD